MNLKFRAPVATAVAIAVGLIVLIGYFLPILGSVRFFLLQTGMVLAAVALLVGVINLLAVHFRKISSRAKGSGYSYLLVLALLGTVLVGFYDMYRAYQAGNPNFQWTNWVFTYIQRPLESTFMAVMAVSLVYAATHLLRRKLKFFTVIFFSVVCLVLIGTIPLVTNSLPILDLVRTWIVRVPAMGGARGILLGIALGTIATGIRILTGSDRPYGG